MLRGEGAHSLHHFASAWHLGTSFEESESLPAGHLLSPSTSSQAVTQYPCPPLDFVYYDCHTQIGWIFEITGHINYCDIAIAQCIHFIKTALVKKQINLLLQVCLSPALHKNTKAFLFSSSKPNLHILCLAFSLLSYYHFT